MFCQKTRKAQYYTPSLRLGARPRGRATGIEHVYTVGHELYTDLYLCWRLLRDNFVHPSIHPNIGPVRVCEGEGVRSATMIYRFHPG